MMRRGGRWGGWVIVLLCAAIAYAKPGIVRTNDGQSFEGDVDDAPEKDQVTVTVRNIPVQIPRTRISAIEYTQSFEQQYAERMAKMDPKDAAGRIQLAREAMAVKQYALARDALESALAVDNNNAEATQLLETVRSLMRLERKAATEPPVAARPPAPGHSETSAATTHAAGGAKHLTPAQINTIKQLEMRPDDREVRIRFEHGVQKRFVELFGAKYPPAQFYAMNAMQQAQAILNDGSPDMRKDVTIVNDPPALFQYRRNVQPFVVQNCATSACHGGGSAKFNLVVPADSESAGYTNFYTLSRYTMALKQQGEAVFGHGEAKIIDRARPEASLLLQYSVPVAVAEQKHPEAAGYKPALRGVTDGRYGTVLNWIGRSIQPVEPDYGIDVAAATTQPATTQPAAKPAATAPAAATVAPPRPVQPPAPRPVQPPRPVAPPRLPR